MNIPPQIPFNLCFMNIILRRVLAYEKQPINGTLLRDWKLADIFDHPWNAITTLFSQVRILKIMMYASAGVNYEQTGFHALNVAPKNELEPTAKTTFSVLSSLPGTKMARIGQMVNGEWHPTSSEERSWLKLDSPIVFADFIYKANGMSGDEKLNPSYNLEITVDTHVKLRGVNYAKLAEPDPLVEDFEELSTS